MELVVNCEERRGESFDGKRYWREVTEWVEFQGHRYERSAHCDYHFEDGSMSPGDNIDENHFTICKGTDDLPHILCGNCHQTFFQIFFGLYSVHARCVSCGKSAEIYSG